jgi:putative spermidine/putrescine transport system permease protein
MIRRHGLDGLVACGLLFLLGPLLVVALASLHPGDDLRFPPAGLSLRWYEAMMARRDFGEAFLNSLLVAGLATVIAGGLGCLGAVALHLLGGRGGDVIRALLMSPLILPTVVTGVALFQFTRALGFESSLPGLVAGHVLITVPYVLRTVGAALSGLDPATVEAAESLGAGPIRVFTRVILPAVAPAVLVGLLFVFIVSFDQVTVSIFLTGPDFTTLPIRLYSHIEFALDPMVAAVSTAMILFAYGVVLLLERLVGLDGLFKGG